MKELLSVLSKHRVITRAIAMLLAIVLTFYVIPSTIFAEIADALGNAEGSTAPLVGETADGDKVIYEDTSRREESTKHFRLPDGTYVAAQYSYPVHTVGANGEYEDIDNTLAEASGGVLATPNARIKFAKKITGNGELFTLHDGSTKLRMSLVGARAGVVGSVTNGEDEENATLLQKMMNLERLTSSVLYPEILDGVDVEYVVESLTVKENVIVKEKKDVYSYTFELKLNGLTAELAKDGDVEIYENGTDELKYVMPAPVVYDANGVHTPTGVAYYALTGGGNGKYALSVTVSAEWMNAEERAFPVTVDPTVGPVARYVVDTEIDSADPSTSKNSATTITVSATQSIYWRTAQLPTVPSDAYITEATFTLYIAEGLGAKNIGAYMVTNSWAATMTYNTYETGVGTRDTKLQDMPLAFADEPYCSFDVTDAVKKWYSGAAPNWGIAISAVSGISYGTDYFTFFSANYPHSRPALAVSYRDMKGVEPYLPYSSHSAGLAGTGSINLGTGQLSLAVPTLTTTTGIMPYTVSLVYNSGLAGKDHDSTNSRIAYEASYMPYGFKLNMCETVKREFLIGPNGLSYTVYIYTDADGTEHTFHYSSESTYYTYFKDEDGLGMTLAIDSSGNVTIEDRDKTVRHFSELIANGWYLSEIEDVTWNKIVFTTDSSYRPIKISLDPASNVSAIDLLELSYNSDGKLSMIYNPSSYEAVVLRYAETYNGTAVASGGKYLVGVDYAHGTSSTTIANWNSFIASNSSRTNITLDSTSTYVYNADGYIQTVRNNSESTGIAYILSGGRYTRVTERSVSTSSIGQSLALVYGVGYTDVRSSGADDVLNNADDIITRYVIDGYGRSVSVYSATTAGSEIHGATMGLYDTGENSKNSLKQQSVLGGSSVNYLTDGGLEDSPSPSSFTYWAISGTGSRVASVFSGDTGQYSARLNPTSGASTLLAQTVNLKAGTYTLSFPYIVESTVHSATVEIYSSPTGSLLHSESVFSETRSADPVTSFFSTTFTLTSNYSTAQIRIRVNGLGNDSESQGVFVDNIMLERGAGASNFSIVSNGGFEATSESTRKWSGVGGSYYTGTSEMTNTFLSISGSPTALRYMSQRVYTAPTSLLNSYNTASFVSNADVAYTLSGFANGTNTVRSGDGRFALRLDVTYYRGSGSTDYVESYYVDFLPGADGWQFASATFNLADATYSCVRYIDVVCEYSYQPSNASALFDNVSLVNNSENTASYHYYGNGLLSRYESGSYKEYYEYNDRGDIQQEANNLGHMTGYSYDEDGNVHMVESINEYTFKRTVGGGTDYPYDSASPYTEITISAKSRTEYIYDSDWQVAWETVDEMVNDSSGAAVKKDGTKSIVTRYTYYNGAGSKIYGHLHTVSNVGDRTMRYFYDNKRGLLLAEINTAQGSGTVYTYDQRGRLDQVRPATYSGTSYSASGDESVEYTYDSANRLTGITTASTTYTLSYDAFGNTSSVGIGGATLASYTYNSYNGKLNKITYGNGHIEEYVYDALENLSEIWYTIDGVETLAYSYEYNSDGSPYKLTDHLNEVTTVYRYDREGRLAGYVTGSGDIANELEYGMTYDEQGRAKESVYFVPYDTYSGDTLRASFSSAYTYNAIGMLSKLTLQGYTGSSIDHYSMYLDYTYDNHGRVTKRMTLNELDLRGFEFIQEYEYRTYTGTTGEIYSDGLVSKYTTGLGSSETVYTYTYDARNNITRILCSTGGEIRYVYDDIGQLVMEENSWLDETLVYTYDDAGNIVSLDSYRGVNLNLNGMLPDAGWSYTYSTSAWGDLLTSFGGRSITYDAIGNPLSYYNGRSYTFSWQGRQLVSATTGGKAYTYTYDDTGLRRTKTVGGVTTTYYYDGSLLISERTDEYTIVYIYDESGSPIGYTLTSHDQQGEGDTYWYTKSLQGDIIGVYANDSTQLVSYVYDAWGKVTRTYHNGGASTGAAKNPFTYRGYYYDWDIGLYYLQSRYYDPITCRFISPDDFAILSATPMSLTDKNLFAYCDNNPVTRVDQDGEFWNIIAGAVIGGGLELAGQLLSGKSLSEVNWAKVGVAAVSGGLTAAVGPVAGCLISGATDVAMDALDGNINSVADAAKSFAWGTAKAAVSYGVGTAVGKATKSLTKVEKVGRLGEDGYPGIKYSYNKGNGRAVRSIELHPNHNNHGIHLQGNKWNPKTGNRGGVFFRWPRRR